MDTLLQDIRYAARKLIRTPGFTFIAVTTLALAIGATTAIFSIVNGVLLKPLPFANPEAIVMIASARDGKPQAMSALDFKDYREQSKSFVGMAGYDNGSTNLTSDGNQPIRLNAAQVGAQFFELLGVKPLLGRSFAAGEDKEGAPRVAMLSERLWRNQFGADARVIGQTITLDGNKVTIVGIAPAALNYPPRADLFVPMVFPGYVLTPDNRGAHYFFAVARVKPGITIEAANNDIAAIAKRLEQQYPQSNTGFGGTAVSLQKQMIGDVDKALYAMFGAVAFVLLIACANVANLLLVRASARESEIAVRTALGAGRSRIVKQLITESVLLSFAGAVIGACLAAWAVDAVVAFGPQGLPRLNEVAIDGRVLTFTAGLGVLTGVFFGLVPAYHAARPNIAQMLRESVRGSSRGGTHRTRSTLVVAEMALAVVLLVGAGLLIRSFVRLIEVDPGFKPENVISFNLTLPSTKYQYDRHARDFAAQVSERLGRLPNVQAVGITFGRPLDNNGMMRTTFDVEGRPPNPPEKRTPTQVHPSSPDFFRALGIPLKRGRLFTQAENRPDVPQVVVVSEEFAKKYFPNEDPIGKRIRLGITHDTAEVGKGTITAGGEIVGIVGDVKSQSLARPTYPATYMVYNSFPIQDIAVLVRTTSDIKAMGPAIRSTMRDIDPDMPIFNLTTMDQAVSDSVAQPRFYMLLLGAFAAIALLLAALGIYGVISYTVSQRTRELGIRIALGATRDKVVRQVIGQGVWLTVAGIAIGVIAAGMLTSVIASMMFGVGKLDPLTFIAVPLTLVGVAMLASYLPARKASNVDPVIAMRAE